MRQLRIDIWSDLACPWCYIGKRHLEQAMATFEHAASVTITWHSFELDPKAPKTMPDDKTMVERLAAKYRVSVAQANAMIARVVDAGARAGLEMRFDIMKSGNTFDAHRLLHWAHERGVQIPLNERLLKAYFLEGVALSDHAELARLAGEAGLPAEEAAAILATDRYAKEVRTDEGLAQEIGISGVPFFVLDGKLGVSGAQPVETMQKVLAQAWDELPAEASGDGEACAVDGRSDC